MSNYIDREEMDALIKAHDYHFESFIENKDFKHFEAAKAIAYKIVKQERSHRAFIYAPDFQRMYFPTWELV